MLAEELKIFRAQRLSCAFWYEAEMAEASASMDYEHAAGSGDQIVAIRSQLLKAPSDDVIKRLKTGARKGSAHATVDVIGKHQAAVVVLYWSATPNAICSSTCDVEPA